LSMLKADPFAHSELFIRRVHAAGAYRVGDGPEAEDITSETFERALRYRSSFDSRRGAAAGLVGIARRCVADAALARTASLDDVAESAAPGELDSYPGRRIEVAAALATFDERQPRAADTTECPMKPGGDRDEDEWRSAGQVV
jgi:DNA-directed RNA polymerase specialized sigma24 family protein